jgi:hypothetical protein
LECEGLPSLSKTGKMARNLQTPLLDYFREMPKLEKLDLSHTALADPGLKELQALRGLKYLLAASTHVSKEGINAFCGARLFARVETVPRFWMPPPGL